MPVCILEGKILKGKNAASFPGNAPPPAIFYGEELRTGTYSATDTVGLPEFTGRFCARIPPAFAPTGNRSQD